MQKILACLCACSTCGQFAWENHSGEHIATEPPDKMYIRLRSGRSHGERRQVYSKRWFSSSCFGEIQFYFILKIMAISAIRVLAFRTAIVLIFWEKVSIKRTEKTHKRVTVLKVLIFLCFAKYIHKYL